MQIRRQFITEYPILSNISATNQVGILKTVSIIRFSWSTNAIKYIKLRIRIIN